MIYKILKGTNTHTRLIELQEKMKAANVAANDLAFSLGGSNMICYGGSPYIIAGGLSAIQYEKAPVNFKKAFKDYSDMFFPKNIPSNKEILEKIKALPLITSEDLNEIVGFEEQTIGRRWILYPVTNIKKDYAVIRVNEQASFTPNGDMVEITVSEYKSLIEP